MQAFLVQIALYILWQQHLKTIACSSTIMDEFQYELKLPKDRIAVLIGKKGQIKREIEVVTTTKISIDSEEGDVFLKGSDALNLYTAKEVVNAIGRGFNPDVALQLLKQDFSFEQLRMDDFCKSKNSQLRLKGRVIGSEGKARRTIEDLTETNICVYGKTIGIIGRTEYVSVARRAIESLLSGSQHANVFRWLEKQRSQLKRMEYDGTDHT
jgi:ribosomal RNA assembly protein